MTSLDLRPLTLGEILDRAFFLYRRHFILFTGIAAIPATITLAFSLIRLFFFGSPRTVITTPGSPAVFSTFDTSGVILTLIYVFIALIAYALSQGGTISAVTEIYLGRQTSIAASFRRAWSETGTLIGTSILNGLVIFLAFLALVIPGFYVACRLIICLPVALVENRGPRDSLSRSWNLTSGYAGRSFLLLLTYSAVAFGIGLLLGAPFGIAILLQRDPATLRIILALNQVASVIASIITTPLLLIGTSIYYFDLRVRKEGFDLQFLLDPSSEHMTRGGSDVPSIL